MSMLNDMFVESMPKFFGDFSFYRMADNDVQVKGKPVHVNANKLGDYNSIKYKNSIFFSPNGDFEQSDGVRQKDTAKNIYCFIIDRDDDGTKVKFREGFEFQPTIVVETARGYHAYWLLKEPVDYATHGEKWSEVENWLVRVLGGDPKAKDIARILRMPGYAYRKGGADGSFFPDVHEIVENNMYDFDDFYAACSAEETIKEQYSFKKFVKTTGDENIYNRINAEVDVVEVLYKLSTRWEVRGGEIFEGGKATDGYRYNKRENYIHSFSNNDRPAGPPYAVAKFFLKTDAEIYRFFLEEFGIGEAKKYNVEITEKKKQTAEDKADVFEKPQKDIVTQVIEGDVKIKTKNSLIHFSQKDKVTYRTVGTTTEEIIDGWINCIGYFKDGRDINVYILKYCKPKGKEGIVYMKELGKGQELEKVLSDVGMTFFGNKNDRKYIIAYIHSAIDEFKFINSVGVYSKDLIINKVGKYIVNEGDVKYFVDISDLSPSDRNSKQVFKIGDELKKDDVLDVISSLATSYDKKIMYSLFTAYAMGFMSYSIRNIFTIMPIVGLVGLTQSGKTTQRKLMMQLFGIDKCLETQAAATEFCIMTMSKHYIPLNIGEYQNELLRFDWDTMFKNNYDNTQNNRGTVDQRMNTYLMNSMLVIDGETRSMTNSVYTRMVMLHMNPQHKKGLLSKVPNINKYFIDNIHVLDNIKDVWNDWKLELTKLVANIEKEEKGRVIDNYALLLAFAECYGFGHIVSEGIIEQFHTQLALLGDDNLQKIIKDILSVAILNNMAINVLEGDIKIHFFADTLRINIKKFQDIKSNIQTTNQHFYPNDEGNSDELRIPLDYVFKIKGFHLMLNRVLDYSFDHYETPSDMQTRQAVQLYAEQGGYTHCRFYNYISNDGGNEYAKLKEQAKRAKGSY